MNCAVRAHIESNEPIILFLDAIHTDVVIQNILDSRLCFPERSLLNN